MKDVELSGKNYELELQFIVENIHELELPTRKYQIKNHSWQKKQEKRQLWQKKLAMEGGTS